MEKGAAIASATLIGVVLLQNHSQRFPQTTGGKVLLNIIVVSSGEG
jgi:hypothetical protein